MAPALDQKPDLLPLLLAGKRGDPRLVRLRFHHPIAGCECPSFGLSDYEMPDDPESFDGALLDSWVYVVFPAGVPNGHDFVASKYFGFTRSTFGPRFDWWAEATERAAIPSSAQSA
ncbi:MAG TPA: hypothetical protein VJV79_06395 [Polyangiaceae bacterium]|nr:hypothetical protein [Polyangiaceae bacterium]